MIDKLEECPICGKHDEWIYDMQYCDRCKTLTERKYGIKKKKIHIVWKTPDGIEFSDESEAIRHCKNINFRNWYKANDLLIMAKNPYFGGYIKVKVTEEEMVKWLKDNRDAILEFLSDGRPND